VEQREDSIVMAELAFITTSNGRLHHIQCTLPLMMAQSPAEIIVVDYGCPQHTGDWVEAYHQAAKVVRVTDDPGFCLPRARNLGAGQSSAPWLCFIDADVEVKEGFVDWVGRNAQSSLFYLAGLNDGGVLDAGTVGTALVHRTYFDKVHGYDEVFRGWGGEDIDLYRRLSAAGAGRAAFPEFFRSIKHDDSERVRFHPVKDKKLQAIINAFYLSARAHASSVIGEKREIPLTLRQDMMDRIARQIVARSVDPSVVPSITFDVAGSGWLPRPHVLLAKSSFTLTLASHRPME
jgi:glycosyltransferase involved in cell wall biosynthesis